MTFTELWRDRWCFTCRHLSRFERDAAGIWRCTCGVAASASVAKVLDEQERIRY